MNDAAGVCMKKIMIVSFLVFFISSIAYGAGLVSHVTTSGHSNWRILATRTCKEKSTNKTCVIYEPVRFILQYSCNHDKEIELRPEGEGMVTAGYEEIVGPTRLGRPCAIEKIIVKQAEELYSEKVDIDKDTDFVVSFDHNHKIHVE